MIIPLIWLKDYIDIDKTPQEIGEDLTALGLMLEKPIENDILELEHRMDRSDWLSVVGCARDLAAMENTVLKLPEGLVPESKGLPAQAGDGNVQIKVEAPDLVRRFNTRVFKNIKVKESPAWLKERLEAYGLPSINNIVDITNYVMVEYGQPMHAQDLSKFSEQEIVLRRAKKGEKIETLLGETVELDEEMLILAEGKNLIGVGAVVGSPATAVDENTIDIILDAGNYNQSNIRKTSRKINLRNETVLRTEKFLHPHSTQVAIERATKLILDLAGGDYYDNEDYYPEEVPLKKMQLRYSRVEKIGGIAVNSEKIKQILQTMEYKILSESDEKLELEVPYFRTDVEVEDDIVSDVLRINNYNNIPHELIYAPPPAEVTPKIYDFEDKCRDVLVGLGLHEHITNPLVKGNGDENQVTLENSLNSEQGALRMSIYETLRPVLSTYSKHKLKNPKLFEVGLVYSKKGSKFEDLVETRVIEIILSTEQGVRTTSSELKSILAAFFKNMGIAGVKYVKENEKVFTYQEGLKLTEVKVDSVTLFTQELMASEKKELRVRSDLTHKTSEDITFEATKDSAVGEVFEKIQAVSDKIADIIFVDEYAKGEKRAITVRVMLEDIKEIGTDAVKEIREQIEKVL